MTKGPAQTVFRMSKTAPNSKSINRKSKCLVNLRPITDNTTNKSDLCSMLVCFQYNTFWRDFSFIGFQLNCTKLDWETRWRKTNRGINNRWCLSQHDVGKGRLLASLLEPVGWAVGVRGSPSGSHNVFLDSIIALEWTWKWSKIILDQLKLQNLRLKTKRLIYF